MYKLGKLPAKHDVRTLRFADYRKPIIEVLPMPEHVDWYKKVSEWGMMGNDVYGDCTVAGAAHMILNWTTAVGRACRPSDQEVINNYFGLTGGADSGLYLLDVLKVWRKRGICGHKIEAFVSIDMQDLKQVKEAINVFGGVYIGISMPDAWFPPDQDALEVPWVYDSAHTPNPYNGHCVMLPGYNHEWGFRACTWGAIKTMDYMSVKTYSDEGYAIVTRDWLDAHGESPLGFNFGKLMADLHQVTRD